MNIKDFLIDNYIWILVIILITIITIIGFLADKKKNSKKNDDIDNQKSTDPATQPLNNVEGQMQNAKLEQPHHNQMNNNFGINPNNMDTTIKPLNQNMNSNMQNNMVNTTNINQGTMPQQSSTIPTSVNTMNNPTTVENIVSTPQPEPMYQPLSEQKITSTPQSQPMPNFSNMTNNQTMVGNQTGNVLNARTHNVNQNVNPMNITQPMQQTIGNQVQQNSMGMQQPKTTGSNNFGPMTNLNQNNSTIPQPVNTVPIPKPVQPQPITRGTYNNQPMMGQPNYGTQMQQPMSTPVQPAPKATQTPNAPVSFVYGPQNNNQ